MKNLSRRNLYRWMIGLTVLVLCAGCASTADKPEKPVAQPVPPAPATVAPAPAPGPATGPSKPSPEVQYFVHTVRFKGESLSTIAGWYTGNIKNWKILAEHNPDINPNRIFEGNKIRIPEYMVRTKAPMTKEYVDSLYPKPSKKEPAKLAPSGPTKVDELVIFGPKESSGK